MFVCISMTEKSVSSDFLDEPSAVSKASLRSKRVNERLLPHKMKLISNLQQTRTVISFNFLPFYKDVKCLLLASGVSPIYHNPKAHAVDKLRQGTLPCMDYNFPPPDFSNSHLMLCVRSCPLFCL